MRNRIGFVCFGLALLMAAPSLAAVSDENSGTDATTTRTFHRGVEAHYGTQTIEGGFTGSNDFLEMTDHIEGGLRSRLEQDLSVDPRVRNNLAPWLGASQSSVEWVLGTPEGLDAAGNLYNDLTQVPGRSVVGVSISAPSFQGTNSYVLQSFQTTEAAPVVVGDPDGQTFGVAGTSVTVTNNFQADVSFYERNSCVTVSPLVIDLDGDGKLEASGGQWLPHAMSAQAASRRALFDFYGNGFPVEMEWVGPNDGLLVKPMADGRVDGTCLFGTATGYDSGWQQLAILDVNKDGKVAGDELKGLAVWQDKNGDAIANAGELTTVQDLGIREISLKHTKMVGSVAINGKETRMWDWWPNGYDLRKRQVSQPR